MTEEENEREAFLATLTPEEREMLAGYEAMAADEEQEKEAMEWCEALIGDLDLDEWDGPPFGEQSNAGSSLRSE